MHAIATQCVASCTLDHHAVHPMRSCARTRGEAHAAQRACRAPCANPSALLRLHTCSSPNCQRQDWNRGHKYECSRLQNQQAVSAANKIALAKDKAAKQQQQQHRGCGQQQQQAAAPPQEPDEEAPVPRQVRPRCDGLGGNK